MSRYNAIADFFDMTPSDDDAIGGAVITGSLLFSEKLIRIEPIVSRQTTNVQGLETERRFTVMVTDQGLVLNERDEMVLTKPATHPYINTRFRISAVNHDSIPGPRGHIELLVTTIVESRNLP